MSTENTPTPAAPETEPTAPDQAAPVEAVTAPGREASEAAPAEAAPETPVEAAPAETEEAKHKRKGGWQRQLDKERQRAEALERELQALRAAQPAPPVKAKTPDEQAAEYVDALVAKRLAEERAKQEQQATQAAFAARTQEVRTAHPDFDEVIASVDVPVSPAVAEALLTSEHGPRIMYQLASNPDELARISALPPVAAAREVGRLEAGLASSTAAPAKPSPTPAPRKPAAPAPITPVTSRGPTAVKDPGSMSYDEYVRYRESQLKQR